MTKRVLAVAAGLLLVASLGVLVWAGRSSEETAAPARDALPGGATQRAAAAAQGQRLLVIQAKRGVEPKGAVYETAHGPSGWDAFAATAETPDPLAAALANLAAAAAQEQARDGRLSGPTVRALGFFGVAVVAVHDGAAVTLPDVGERDPHLGVVPEVPAVRVRAAQPVFLFLAEETRLDPADALGFARALRSGTANFLGYEDHAPWGGDVAIVADAPSRYLLTFSAAGARVTVDGRPAAFRASHVGMIVLDLPAGRHEVSVRFGPDRSLRNALVIAAAALAVASFLALWLLLRPTPAPAP